MSILRKASAETKTLYLDDEKSDFIEVRADITKREFNALASAMPESASEEGQKLSLAEATGFQRYLFGALVTGWSMKEDATVEAYDDLSVEAGNAVDAVLAEHFESIVPSSAEGK